MPVTSRKVRASLGEDRTRSNAIIDFIQNEEICRIPEGPKIGEKFVLDKWQIDFIRQVYDNPARTRRAILSVGRKNAKTTLSALLLLAHLCGPERKGNAQLYSAATSRDQAALIFRLALKMVRMSARLRSAIQVKESAKELVCPTMGTHYRALSAETATAFGLNPSFVVHDELGQVRGPRSPLFEALETATGAQERPLSIIISTQAATDNDLLSILIDDALAGHDPQVTVTLFTAAPELDPFDLKTVKLANPALGKFLQRKEVMAMADSARRMPASEASFRNLILNQRIEASNPFVSTTSWRLCGGQVESLRGVPIYAGLDLSSVSDLTAFVMIGRIGKVWHVEPTFWLPGVGLHHKAQKDRTPYDMWAKEGYLQTTDGATISYEYVAQYLFEMFQKYDIRKIAFDRWGFAHFRPWLVKAGFTEQAIEDKFVQFGQGTQTMSPALRDLEQAIKERQLAHGNHPVLGMCAACAVIEGKDYANRKLSKNKSSGRIDGLVALTMAMGVAPLQAKPVDISALIG
jgi:phage terminase large subunit-like protein